MKILFKGTVVFLSLCYMGSTIGAVEKYSVNQEMISLAEVNKGIFNNTVRTGFIRLSAKSVMKELADVSIELSAKQLEWIKKDKELYTAAFGTVYPPDPRIVLNLLELRAELGEKLCTEYKSLIIGASVARRHYGLGEGLEKGKKQQVTIEPVLAEEKRTGTRFWPVYKYFAPKITHAALPTPASRYSPAKLKKKKKKRASKDAAAAKKLTGNSLSKDEMEIVDNFLKKKRVSPRQLYESEDLKEELVKLLKHKGDKFKEIKTEFLMHHMAEKGLRTERDPWPSVADTCRFLIRNEKENLRKGKEPLFLLKGAPWPLLMPFGRGWPINEAKDIIKQHEPGGRYAKKLKVYGSYRSSAKVVPYKLEPLAWSWNSWQGIVNDGGVCSTMSTIGVGTFMSMGKPSLKAGGPGHSCLLVYNRTGERYVAAMKQASSSNEKLQATWLFADIGTRLPFYMHTGLALAQNLGTASYLDSRMGVHLGRLLNAEGKFELAESMLKSLLKINLYNPEIFIELVKACPKDKPEELHLAETLVLMSSITSTSSSDVLENRIHDASQEITDDVDVTVKATRKQWVSTFIKTVANMIILKKLKPVIGNRELNIKILALLRKTQDSSINVSAHIPYFEIAIRGWLASKAGIAKGIKGYVDNATTDTADILTQLKAVEATASTKDSAFLPWLLEMKNLAAGKMFIVKKGGRKVSASPMYEGINKIHIARLMKMKRKSDAKAVAAKLVKAVADKKAAVAQQKNKGK